MKTLLLSIISRTLSIIIDEKTGIPYYCIASRLFTLFKYIYENSSDRNNYLAGDNVC